MKISILGCGWLGYPLAKHLLAAGHELKGSSTTKEKLSILSAEGIDAYLLKISSKGIEGDMNSFLKGTTTLIVDIPPRFRKDPTFDYFKALDHLTTILSTSEVKNVLLISSISVYEDTEDIPQYTEETEPNSRAERALGIIAVERLLQRNSAFRTSILRLGGLIGPDRHPVKQLSGRTSIPNPEAPINLIHQKDSIGIIERIIERESFGEVFNAVYPSHPSKKSYYIRKAKEEGLMAPEFSGEASKGKIILSLKVEDNLGYSFKEGIF